jgi:hypothetical protein
MNWAIVLQSQWQTTILISSKKIENCKPDNYMKIMTQTSRYLEFVSKIFGKICQQNYLGIPFLKYVLPEI